MLRRFTCVVIASLVVLGALVAPIALAQSKKLKIGVVYDYSGPLAGGGSDLHALGAKIMIDHFVKKGGVEGYQIEALYADAQSKPEVAINEAVRLIEQEKVDMLLGFYSSAQCVPAAARIEQLKKFMWITTCISSAVLENRNLKYVFRIQPSGRQFGLMSMDFIEKNEKSHVGMSASNTYVFMSEVLPRAIKKHGGIDAEALRKAALEVDLPEGGTMLGFGVKFEGEQDQMAGQNDRAF